jgi:hypothetical protein
MFKSTWKPTVTHMVVYYNTVKFKGTLSQCINEKKKLAKIHGSYGLKIVPIHDF